MARTLEETDKRYPVSISNAMRRWVFLESMWQKNMEDLASAIWKHSFWNSPRFLRRLRFRYSSPPSGLAVQLNISLRRSWRGRCCPRFVLVS